MPTGTGLERAEGKRVMNVTLEQTANRAGRRCENGCAGGSLRHFTAISMGSRKSFASDWISSAGIEPP